MTITDAGPLDRLYAANAELAARFFRAAMGHTREHLTPDEIETIIMLAPKGLTQFVVSGDGIWIEAAP